MDNKSEKDLIIDPSCFFETRIEQKEEEKVSNTDLLNFELVRPWKLKFTVIPVDTSALGMVTNRMEIWIKKLGANCTVELLQKGSLLGMVRERRKIL